MNLANSRIISNNKRVGFGKVPHSWTKNCSGRLRQWRCDWFDECWLRSGRHEVLKGRKRHQMWMRSPGQQTAASKPSLRVFMLRSQISKGIRCDSENQCLWRHELCSGAVCVLPEVKRSSEKLLPSLDLSCLHVNPVSVQTYQLN